MNKRLPVFLFFGFFTAVILAFVWLAPSWGLMDDFQNVKMAREIWSSPAPFKTLSENFMGAGMFRPVYFSWIAVFYFIFQYWPTGFYVFNALCMMLALVLWGNLIFKVFEVRREDYYWTVFFYPLSFFIFTAFWNVLNYISLQEKLIVLFAPAVFLFVVQSYRENSLRPLPWTVLFVALGIFSKATFIFVPAVLALYALVDLIIVRYRPRISAWSLVVNAVMFAVYAVFTLAVQLNQSYTEKYKANLGLTTFFERILHMSLVMKIMLLIGMLGAAGVLIHSVIRRKPGYSLSLVLYFSLAAYVLLLSPWGSQSYLLSATGPLVLASLFPVYDWFVRRGSWFKTGINGLVGLLVVLLFFGNIVPEISRMSDIGRAVAFLKEFHKPTAGQDMYFMPPPFSESANATGSFSGKNVVFCGDGRISQDLLSTAGDNYVLFNEYFPSVKLEGAVLGQLVYSNRTWKIYELKPQPGHEEKLTLAFPNTLIQQVKIRIRNLY